MTIVFGYWVRFMKLLWLLFILIVSFSLPGQAGEIGRACYKVLYGNETKSCRLLEENLNKFCDITFSEIACNIRIHPDYAQYFSIPKWEVIPYKGNEKLARAMMYSYPDYEYICNDSDSANVENCYRRFVQEWKRQLTSWSDERVNQYTQMLESGQFQITRANFDIDNDGKMETVHRFHKPSCVTRSEKAAQIYQEQGSNAYIEYTKELDKADDSVLGLIGSDWIANEESVILSKDSMALDSRFHQEDRISGDQFLIWEGRTLMTATGARYSYNDLSRRIVLQETYRFVADKRGVEVHGDPGPSRHISNKASSFPSYCVIQHLLSSQE